MNNLLELNKRFLIKGYLWISVTLTFGFSIYLIFSNTEISTEWILIIYILSLIILPLFVLSAWISDLFRTRRNKKRILNKKPYNDLQKIGFTKKTVKQNYRGLKEYVLFSEINGYQITFDVDNANPKIVEFIIYKPTNFLNKIDFTKYTFTKKIDTSKEKLNSIYELEKILTEMTHLVKN